MRLATRQDTRKNAEDRIRGHELPRICSGRALSAPVRKWIVLVAGLMDRAGAKRQIPDPWRAEMEHVEHQGTEEIVT